MDEQNVTPKDEEQDEQDTAPEQEVSEPEEEQQEETTQPEEPEAEEQEDTDEEVEEDDTPEPSAPQRATQAPRLTVKDIVNEDETVNLDKMQEWADSVVQHAEQRAAGTVTTQLQEQKSWEKVYEKYPEWKDNKRMRDIVHKQRIGDMYSGGKNDLVRSADKIAKLLGKAESSGKKKAQTSITRQKAANLETASNTTDASADKNRELMNKLGSKNRQEAQRASQDLLKQWLEEGKI